MIKGAPDILIDRCSHIVSVDGSVQALEESTLNRLKQIKDQWSSEGKRVILLARKIFRAEIQASPLSHLFEAEVMNQVKSDLVLVGLVGIVDPPRDEIPDVIRTLRKAGIRIFMVSVSTPFISCLCRLVK
jgi:sodium/potassium-transporting ATPase subunit alpha